MDSLVEYYLHQAGRGTKSGYSSSIGPDYYDHPFLKKGRGIGDFFGGLFRWLRPIFTNNAKELGRKAFRAIGNEALKTGSRMLTDMADSPDISTRDIITKQLGVAGKKLINKMRGGGRKRKRAASVASTKRRRTAHKRKKPA